MSGGEWFELLAGLLGGLAIFLFGLDRLTGALKLAAGDALKRTLQRLAGTALGGLLTGAGATALLQSSSVTTVLTVGFVSSGLLSLQQSVAIIIGSNIGTTVTGQIVAFKITEAALPLVAVGFALLMLGGRGNLRHLGAVVLGLGLLFHGMGLMSDAMLPLREDAGFISLMARLDNPLAAILVAAVFTALVQSSSATTGIVITLATQGLISLPAGIALALGANVGTCVTAQLAALGRALDARRVALVHLLFNLGGALLLVWFIPQYAELIRSISPQSSELSGTARLAADLPRQIANANTLFNALMALLCIGFTARIAELVKLLLPEREPRVGHEDQPARTVNLLPDYLETPALALDMLRSELARIGEIAAQLLDSYAPGSAPLPPGRAGTLAARAVELREQCAAYAGRLSAVELEPAHSEQLLRLMTAGNDLENICSLLGRRLNSLPAVEASVSVAEPASPSVTALSERLDQLFREVSEALALARRALEAQDYSAAAGVAEMKHRINGLEDAAALEEARALAAENGRGSLHELSARLDALPRIYHFARRVAKHSLPPGRRRGIDIPEIE